MEIAEHRPDELGDLGHGAEVHDVIVVGGGPAGAATAIGLRRGGASVLVLEAQRMPRDKPCGDILGTQALGLIANLGLGLEVLRPYPRLRGFALHVTGRRTTVSRSERIADGPRVVPRETLDGRLLNLAVDAGAEVRWARVEDVVDNGAWMTVRSRSGDDDARLVVGADGWGSVVARSVFGDRHRGQVGLAGRAYVEDPRGFDGRMHVFYSRETQPGYGWLFPIDATHANAGVGVLRGGGEKLPRLFEGFLYGEGSPLRHLLSDASRIHGQRSWPLALGWTARRRAGGRALLVGDAASLVGPLTGAGIHSALRSGLMGARAAIAALESPDAAAAHLAGYERACERWFRPRLAVERGVQLALSSRHGLSGLSGLFSASPQLDALWTRLLFSLG